jgi:hypothetical protein
MPLTYVKKKLNDFIFLNEIKEKPKNIHNL